MAEPVLGTSDRGDDEIQKTSLLEQHTLKRAVAIETYVRSFRLHHGLVTGSSNPLTLRMEGFVGTLAQKCTLTQLAQEGGDALVDVLQTSSGLARAALASVAEAYAYTVGPMGDLEEFAGAVVPYLPLWADSRRFVCAFKLLATFTRRTADTRPVDLSIILGALHALKEACDACGELLAAACSTPVSASTWDSGNTAFAWNVFGSQPTSSSSNSFTPPDTPEHGSPTPARSKSLPNGTTSAPKPLAQPPRRETISSVKTAFESVPSPGQVAPTGVNYELLPVGLMAALDDSIETASSLESMSDELSEGGVSPSYHHSKIYWHQASKPQPPMQHPAYDHMPMAYHAEEEWAQMMAVRNGDVYSRLDKMLPALQWKERPTGFRVVMCRHMDSKGKCKKAGTCTFAHSQPDLERFRALFIPTERCNYGAKCVYRSKNCQYSHTPTEQHRSIKYYNLAVAQACANSA